MSVVEYYDKENIILIQINLKSDQDLDELESKITKPDIVATCFNPKCNACGHFQQKTTMTIVDRPCWKCHSKMKVAILEGSQESGGSHVGPDGFTADEIKFARDKGVLISEHYSKTVRAKYLANACAKCGAFVGNHYLFTGYFVYAVSGEFPSTTFEIGYSCGHCAELAYERSTSTFNE